jgi:hypothetical protein
MRNLYAAVRASALLLIIYLAKGRKLANEGSSSSFSFGDALLHDTDGTIIVPGDHSVTREFDQYYQSPLQLNR